jgi:microcystin-dependent protein
MESLAMMIGSLRVTLGIIIVAGLAFLYYGSITRVDAQVSAVQTFIPASGVGGTSNAVTLSVPNIRSMADLVGVPIRFFPKSNAVAGGATINVNSYGTNAVDRLSAGTLVSIADHDLTTAAMAEVIWDGTEFQQTNPATGTVPVGTEIVVTGGSAAPFGYLIENGACLSQTTYAALYALYGSTDTWSPGNGASCSGSQFHVKFANGRASVASNTQGSQTGPLTNCTATVGVVCGAQTATIAQSALPNTTLTVSTTVNIPSGQGAHSHLVSVSTSGTGTGGAGNLANYSGLTTTSTATLPAMSGTSTGSTSSMNGGVSQTALATVPPVNSNIFAVKY